MPDLASLLMAGDGKVEVQIDDRVRLCRGIPCMDITSYFNFIEALLRLRLSNFTSKLSMTRIYISLPLKLRSNVQRVYDFTNGSLTKRTKETVLETRSNIL